jgi:hypothetical protein
VPGIELHAEGGKERRGRRVIAHQRDQIDELAAAELRERACVSLGRHLARAENFAAERDDSRVGLVEAGEVAAMADDIDQLGRDSLAPRLFLVGGPFELAVELARRHKDGELAHPPAEPRLEPQIAVERAGVTRQFRAMELDAAGAAQPAQVVGGRRGDAVIG